MENETPRQKYYRAHKDEPEFRAKAREQSRAFYYRNLEKQRAEALFRYYIRKQLVEDIE